MAEDISFYLEVSKGFSEADRAALETKVNAALREGAPDEQGRCSLSFGETSTYFIDPLAAQVLLAALSGTGALAVVLTKLIVVVSDFFRNRDAGVVITVGPDGSKRLAINEETLRDPNVKDLLIKLFESIRLPLRPDDPARIQALTQAATLPGPKPSH
jgi:hypothetical protein